MNKLNSESVTEILKYCLFQENEPTTDAVIVKGVVSSFGFHPARLETKKQEIGDLLSELPIEFQDEKSGGGGGYSFLGGCMTKDGEQWGEQKNVDELLCLGLAIKRVMFPLPETVWFALPGGVPYFIVISPE